MNFQNKDFPKIESVRSTRPILLVKTLGAFIIAGIILSVINLGISTNQSGRLSVIFQICSVLLSVFLISFLAYVVFKGAIYIKENKTTKVIVDQNGLHHYANITITESITFEYLHPNPDRKNYDVVLAEGEDTGYNICLYYFEKSVKAPVYKAITFNTPFSIRNARELERHFITGILMFRPDLNVSPKVLDLLDLKNSAKTVILDRA